MDALEGAGVDLRLELALRRVRGEIDVLRTDDDIDLHILAEALVHAVELVLDEGDAAVADHPALEDVALADEVRDEAVDGLVVDVHRGADLLDAALVEDDDGVGEGEGLLLVVGDVDEGDAQLLVHLLQLDLHVLAHLEVQGGEGLVQEEHLRLVHDGAGDGDTLLLAAGEGLHVAVLVVGHRDELEDPADALLDLLLGHFLELEAEGDVVVHVQVREQGVALEHGVQRTLVRRDAGEFLAVHEDGAFVRLEKARDHPEEGGLAAAGRAQQGDEFAAADIQVDVLQDLLVAEGFGEVLDLDDLVHAPREC